MIAANTAARFSKEEKHTDKYCNICAYKEIDGANEPCIDCIQSRDDAPSEFVPQHYGTLVEDLRHHFNDVPLVMQGIAAIEELMLYKHDLEETNRRLEETVEYLEKKCSDLVRRQMAET